MTIETINNRTEGYYKKIALTTTLQHTGSNSQYFNVKNHSDFLNRSENVFHFHSRDAAWVNFSNIKALKQEININKIKISPFTLKTKGTLLAPIVQ